MKKILLMDILVKRIKPDDKENSCKAPGERQDTCTEQRTTHTCGQKLLELEHNGVRDRQLYIKPPPPAVCLLPIKNIFQI